MRAYIRCYLFGLAVTAVLLSGVGLAQAVGIQWFGQSAFKFTTNGGKVILIDPFITKNPIPLRR